MKDSAWTRSQRPPGLGRQELRTGQEVTSLGRGRSLSVRVRDCNTRRLSHERVSPDFAAGDAGPVCSVLQTAGSPSARTLHLKRSTLALLGRHWLLPASSDPGPRNPNGSTDPGGDQGPWDLPLGLLLHRS